MLSLCTVHFLAIAVIEIHFKFSWVTLLTGLLSSCGCCLVMLPPYKQHWDMMDFAATGQQLRGPFSQGEGQESLSSGLSQRICGLGWMPCTCDRGSNLSQPLFRAQAFFLSNPTTLYIHSRQSCEERMFPPTQTGRQAAAPGSSSPPTVMLWNAVYGKPSLTACSSLKSAQAGSWRQHFKTPLIYWFIVILLALISRLFH